MSYDPELCQGSGHSCAPLTTQRHHLFPKYLCGLLGVPYRREVVPLCGTCHDSVHHLLHHLINEGSASGHRRGAAYWSHVDAAWKWWQASLLTR